MHVPAPFRAGPAAVLALLRAHGFMTLVHPCEPDGRPAISAAHVPVLVAERDDPRSDTRDDRGDDKVDGPVDGMGLELHLARANPLVARLAAHPHATLIAQGPSSYVTPSWYAAREAVPTWNFAAVHLHGRLEAFTAPDAIVALLDRTAAAHEPSVGGAWARGPHAQAMIDALVSGVVGYRFTVERHEAMVKMSQNMPAADHEGVVRGLRALDADGAHAVADLMEATGRGG